MKKIICILCFLQYCTGIHAYEICGPGSGTGRYSANMQELGTDDMWTDDAVWRYGEWSVTGVASGYSICADPSWYNAEESINTDHYVEVQGGPGYQGIIGYGCFCRRDYVTINGVSTYNKGAWVLMGATVDDSGTCREDCADICAQAVLHNTGGMRNAILLLPGND